MKNELLNIINEINECESLSELYEKSYIEDIKESIKNDEYDAQYINFLNDIECALLEIIDENNDDRNEDENFILDMISEIK